MKNSDYLYIIFLIFIFIYFIFGDEIVSIFKKNINREEIILNEKKTIKIKEELKSHIGQNVRIKFKDNFNIIAIDHGQNVAVKIIDVDDVWIEAEFCLKKGNKRKIFKIADVDNIDVSLDMNK